MKREKNDHRKLSIHPLIYTGKVFFITWWDSTRAGHCTSAWLPTLKKLQYLFTHKAFTASNRVQAPLRTSHNNLYVFSVICHAPVNLIWHPKSAKRSQLLTNLSQAVPMESECKLLLKAHVGTRKAKVRWVPHSHPATAQALRPDRAHTAPPAKENPAAEAFGGNLWRSPAWSNTMPGEAGFYKYAALSSHFLFF